MRVMCRSNRYKSLTKGRIYKVIHSYSPHSNYYKIYGNKGILNLYAQKHFKVIYDEEELIQILKIN